MLIPGKLYKLSTDDFGAAFNFVRQGKNGLMDSLPKSGHYQITNDIVFYVGKSSYLYISIPIHVFISNNKTFAIGIPYFKKYVRYLLIED